jgi:hypothetical protein
MALRLGCRISDSYRTEAEHGVISEICQERKLDGVDRMACLGPLSLRSRLQEVI